MKYWLIVAGLLLSLPGWAQGFTQEQLRSFAKGANVQFSVISNLSEGGAKAQLLVNNQSEFALPAGAGNWAIYFHAIRKLSAPSQAGLSLAQVQGDLYRLAPTADFTGLAKGQALSFVYQLSSSMVSYTDFMPRAFIVSGNLAPEVFANTDTEVLSQFVAPLQQAEQLQRSAVDQVPMATSQQRYRVNQARASAPLDITRVIPQVLESKQHRGTTAISAQWQIRYAGRLASEAGYLQERLRQVGLALSSEPAHVEASGPIIRLQVDPSDSTLPEAPESYTLRITRDAITLNGRDNAGAFYAIQTFLNLLPASIVDSHALTYSDIIDSPRKAWRGMHYDMARNFHGKEVTLRLIEQMARYKLNKLHLHLTEDEGWRLEIPGLPELTTIGAYRCFDLTERQCLLTQLGTGPHKSGSGNGYYSRDDFIDIIKYAAARHIEVIPEIDLPGHARAAIKAMEARHARLLAEGDSAAAQQYLLSDPSDRSAYLSVQHYTDNALNVCMESSYAFVDKVMYELQAMYREAGQALKVFHVGGDEVGKGAWSDSPACAALIEKTPGVAGTADLKPYFVSRVAELANRRGLALAGWEDGLMYDSNTPFNRSQFDNKHVIANLWDNIWEWGAGDRAYRLANAGYGVVLSHATHLYFDHPYEAHPDERGYYWATRYIDTDKVFSYMPDHIYSNATTTIQGAPIQSLELLLGRPLTPLEKPENILGIQGQVWGETIRTAEQLEALVYPRLLALAERAWHQADWEAATPNTGVRDKDYASFAHTMVMRELPKLEAAGISVYLPPPGARIEGGKLYANTAIAGLAIEVSRDGKTWQPYSEPVAVTGDNFYLRTRAGQLASRAVSFK